VPLKFEKFWPINIKIGEHLLFWSANQQMTYA
jgi:hypothetical protein